MNFTDLVAKMKQIDECGEMMPVTPKQPDNVTMNVTASGAGGIKDLIALLKQIDQDGNPDDTVLIDKEPHQVGHEEPIMGAIVSSMEHGIADEEYANAAPGASGPTTKGIDAVTQTGDDLASKGKEALKRNGGGNPMQEALIDRLAAMYEEVKAKKEKEPEGLYSKKRFETDSQRLARLAREKRQAEKKERMRNMYNDEMER